MLPLLLLKPHQTLPCHVTSWTPAREQHKHTHTRVHACNTQSLQMCANNNTCEYSRAEPNVLSQPPHSHAFSSHLSSLSTHIHTQCQEDHAVFISTLCFIAQIALLWSGTWSKPQTETIATHFCGNSFACPLYTHTHTHTHALPHSTRTHSSEWLHIFSLTLKTFFSGKWPQWRTTF